MTKLTPMPGPPPHVGWWQAVDPLRIRGEWRWWNGEHWSVAVTERYTAAEVKRAARTPARFGIDDILWSHHWPRDARVPRLDPRGGHWTFTDWTPPTARTVEVAFRNGATMTVDTWLMTWTCRGIPGDIVAWRLPPGGRL